MLTLEPLGNQHRDVIEPLAGPEAFAPQPDTDFRAIMVDGECVGMAMLRLAPENSIELNVSTVSAHHRKGYGREAARQMLRVAFEEHNLPRVLARCLNGRAGQRLVEKLPFRYLGPFQGSEIYQITRAEWQATLAGDVSS